MTKQEVINGLKCHAGAGGCSECPYKSLHGVNNMTCPQHLTLDALNLLKKREPITPCIRGEEGFSYSNLTRQYECGSCGKSIDRGDEFCRHCGKAVKWDE